MATRPTATRNKVATPAPAARAKTGKVATFQAVLEALAVANVSVPVIRKVKSVMRRGLTTREIASRAI